MPDDVRCGPVRAADLAQISTSDTSSTASQDSGKDMSTTTMNVAPTGVAHEPRSGVLRKFLEPHGSMCSFVGVFGFPRFSVEVSKHFFTKGPCFD